MRKKSKLNIRIKDIAQRAGVSVGTVDRVLHQRGEVSPETKKIILGIIEDLEYSPNLLASTLASSRIHKLSVLIPAVSNNNNFWAEHLKGINRAGAELKAFGVELDIHTFTMTNTRDFREKADIIIKSKPDSILLAPVFYKESVHFLVKCQKNKIPIAFIDTPINEFEYICFIGQNSYQSGAVAAKLLRMGNNDDDSYLVFNITREKDQLHHLSDREKGFREFFEKKNYKSDIFTVDIYDENPDSIKAALENFSNYPDQPKGIFVTGSKVHRVAEVLDKSGRRNIRLVGYDLIQKNIEYLKTDVIDFLISQQPEEQGYLGVTSIYNSLVQKKEVPGLQTMPIDIITGENLVHYLK